MGADPNKMVLGIPTYGRGHRLADPANNGLLCETDGPIGAGPVTGQEGILGYVEVLELFNETETSFLPDAVPGQWTVVRDDCLMAPYATNGPYWLSYDDEESVAYKVRYANLMGLRGAMVWALETDDFRGLYSDQDYPLIRRIVEELELGLTFNPDKPCGIAPVCDFVIPTQEPTIDP